MSKDRKSNPPIEMSFCKSHREGGVTQNRPTE